MYYTESSTIHPPTMRNATVDANTLETELTSLHKFTDYTIFVVAFSSRDGLSSNKTVIRTAEDSKLI